MFDILGVAMLLQESPQHLYRFQIGSMMVQLKVNNSFWTSLTRLTKCFFLLYQRPAASDGRRPDDKRPEMPFQNLDLFINKEASGTTVSFRYLEQQVNISFF